MLIQKRTIIMLITFKTKAHASITMFEKVALSMLQMMGHSQTVPGAIPAADVPEVLSRLKAAIETGNASPPIESNDPDEPAVSMVNRATPLIDLLAAAAKEGEDVMWEKASVIG